LQDTGLGRVVAGEERVVFDAASRKKVGNTGQRV
jgi:hypothetical protein